MPTIIGIDPGKSGGIAIATDGDVEVHKMSDMTIKDMWMLLSGQEPATAILENVHAGPNMGSSAAFKFGKGFGCLDMACVAAGLVTIKVSPQKWQRSLGLIVSGRGLGQRDTDKKNRNKAKAQELFPQVKVTHAIADALLLAHYGTQLKKPK